MQTLTIKVCDNQAAKFDADDENLTVGDYVIVESDTGSEWGVVASAPTEKRATAKENAQVLRKADAKDEKQIALLLKSAVYAKAKCGELVEKLKLDMKVISAYYNFDASKVTIYFSAEQRVDFRELVRQLSGTLRTRTELRQIGARDEVKIKGAVGTCGCVCCCKKFWNEYPEVSIKMAKNQGIALNPDKINGMCGRLKCCLSYEDDNYTDGKIK
jgi:cell fate regulator YaaT (PSP1 superfamily)